MMDTTLSATTLSIDDEIILEEYERKLMSNKPHEYADADRIKIRNPQLKDEFKRIKYRVLKSKEANGTLSLPEKWDLEDMRNSALRNSSRASTQVRSVNSTNTAILLKEYERKLVSGKLYEHTDTVLIEINNPQLKDEFKRIKYRVLKFKEANGTLSLPEKRDLEDMRNSALRNFSRASIQVRSAQVGSVSSVKTTILLKEYERKLMSNKPHEHTDATVIELSNKQLKDEFKRIKYRVLKSKEANGTLSLPEKWDLEDMRNSAL